MKTIVVGILAMVLTLTSAIAATAMDEPIPVDRAFSLSVERDGDGIALTWRIADGYYLYRERMAGRSSSGSDIRLETPAGVAKDDPNFGASEVYYGAVQARALHLDDAPFDITYQGCQEDGICYAPETRTIDPLTLAVTGPAPGSRPQFDWITEGNPASGKEQDTASFQLADDDGLVEGLLGRGGIATVLAMFALFGLLLAFTPCVFPMYPIIAAALSREGGNLTPRRGLRLSAAYVLGLASAFAMLGAFAGWSGQNLQMLLQSTWTTVVVVSIFVALALSMFGLFELQLPAAITNRISARTSGGSAIALGFSSALIVGPCVTAPLAGGLLYIARSGDVMLGAAALFMLGVGKGLPLLVIGGFGGRFLPRAGAWMVEVKRIFGFLFLGTAIWLATPMLPPSVDLILWALLLMAFAFYLSRLSAPRGAARLVSPSIATVVLLGGTVLMAGGLAGSTDPLRPLAALTDRQSHREPVVELSFTPVGSVADLQEALTAGVKPSLVYFTADWCVTCKGIERSVFPNADVRQALSGFQLLKADVTDFDAQDATLMEQMRVAGPPTMVFFDGAGREHSGTRLAGNITTETIIRSVDRLRGD